VRMKVIVNMKMNFSNRTQVGYAIPVAGYDASQCEGFRL